MPCPSPANFSLGMSAISVAAVMVVFLIVTRFAAFQDTWVGDDRPLSNSTGLHLFGDLQLNLDAPTSSVSWAVVLCDSQTTAADRLIPNGSRMPAHCKPPSVALDVYITSLSKPDFSYVPLDLTGESPVVWDHLCFTTEHRIHRYNNPAPSRQLMAPSDHYVFDTLAFVIDPAANHSVRIATLAVTGTIGDFVVRSHDAAATNVLNSSPGGELVNTGIESRVLQVEIELSVIALANAISLFLINWLAAVGSIYVTIMVTSGRLERNNVAAAGPFSALVAVPTVRSLYISSPVLTGPVESAAFFVEVAAVVSCSVILLGVFTKPDDSTVVSAVLARFS